MKDKILKILVRIISVFGMFTCVLNFILGIILAFNILIPGMIFLYPEIELIKQEMGVIFLMFFALLFVVYLKLFYFKNWARKMIIILSLFGVIGGIFFSLKMIIPGIMQIITNTFILYFLGFNKTIKRLFNSKTTKLKQKKIKKK